MGASVSALTTFLDFLMIRSHRENRLQNLLFMEVWIMGGRLPLLPHIVRCILYIVSYPIDALFYYLIDFVFSKLFVNSFTIYLPKIVIYGKVKLHR